jgi:hypothetical protein
VLLERRVSHGSASAEEVLAYLTTIREQHLGNLRRLLAYLQSEHGEVIGDFQVELSQSGVFAKGLKRFAAAFSVSDGPQFRDVKGRIPEGLAELSLEVTIRSAPSCRVRLRPFAWNSCQVEIENPEADWRAVFDGWFDAWIDPRDSKPIDEAGLHGVIHSVDEPRFSQGRLAFGVDFGSAPVEAVTSLFEEFAIHSGARSFRLGDPGQATQP